MFLGKRKLKAENASLREQLKDLESAEPFIGIDNAVDSSEIVRGHNLFDVFTGSPSSAGTVVNERTAMTVSAVYACVALISGAISGLPLPLYQRTATGREGVNDNDVHWLLTNEPTPVFSAATFWEYVVASILLGGDGYAEIKRNYRGDALGFEPHHFNHVEAVKKDGRLIYLIYPDEGEAYAIDQDDMIHLPGVGFNGLRSLSPIRHAAKNAIGTAIAASEYNAEFFANGARPDFALTATGKVDKEARENLLETWNQKHQGKGRRHIPAILSGGLDVKELTMSAQDSQLIDILRFQVVDIARAYGVPPHMIAETEKNTSWGSGIEQLTIGFVKFALRPHLNRIQRELNRKLFRKTNLYFEFNVAGLMQGDSKAQAEYFAKALGGPGSQGWMAVDEVRRIQNLAPQGEEFAKVHKSGEKPNEEQTTETTD